MSAEMLDDTLRWAADEGWNPGLHDACLFWQADPQGFLALMDGTRHLGSGASVNYGGDLGFMGLFIISPECRRQGMGRTLWFHRRDNLLARLKPGAPIGMDGVIDMTPFYARGGFRTHHFHCRMAAYGPVSAHRSEHSRPVDHTVIPAILDMDASLLGARRDDFMRRWIQQRGHVTMASVSSNGEVNGFAVLRPCQAGYKIGPLLARNASIAHALMAGVTAGIETDAPVFLDIPDINAAAVDLTARLGFTEVFRCARMYLGTPPVVDWEQVFGVCTLELG
jgi:ribosomal protein S18 acetylase RimI-like enzyme